MQTRNHHYILTRNRIEQRVRKLSQYEPPDLVVYSLILERTLLYRLQRAVYRSQEAITNGT